MVVVQDDTSADDLHQLVTIVTAPLLEVNVTNVYSKFNGRSYVLDTCSLAELGMYHCCSVSVQYARGWTIYVEIPDGATLKVATDGDDLVAELHEDVVQRASEYFDCHPTNLYSLYNGKLYQHLVSATVKELGMFDGCHVVVHARIKGSICVKNRVGGRKRTVRMIYELFSVVVATGK